MMMASNPRFSASGASRISSGTTIPASCALSIAAGPFAVGSAATSVPAAALACSTPWRRATSCGPMVLSIGLVS